MNDHRPQNPAYSAMPQDHYQPPRQLAYHEQPLDSSPREDKRRRESVGGDPDDDENGSQYGNGEDSKPNKKKHKGRAVLSCGECKRRKVK
jgi:hypothetical protein